ncbi:MAG: DUF2314 domain-containing protein, partial [Vicinamibacterales bacterium]
MFLIRRLLLILQVSAKVRFPVTGGGGHEHIWVTDLAFRQSALVGKVGNEPRDVADLRLGSSVTVNEADISDWACVE